MFSSSQNSFRSVEVAVGPALVPTIGLTILAVFLQTVFAPYVTFHTVVPSLVTIAVVLYAAKAGITRGVLVATIAGALEDSFAGTGGAWTIATTLMALAVGAISRTFFADGLAMLGALVTLATILRDALFWVVMSIEGYPRGFALPHFHAALWQGAVTGLCTLAYLGVRVRFGIGQTIVERYP